MNKINFSEAFIPKIISGEKTQTRRLVKEGEYFDYELTRIPFQTRVVIVCSKLNGKGKVKWQVGKKYPVCVKGKQVWYCPKCKSNLSIAKYIYDEIGKSFALKIGAVCNNCEEYAKPLFIELTAIRKEKLLDITEEEAKKEGFKDRTRFIEGFCWIYYKWNAGEVFRNIMSGKILSLNPDVWVLEFKVVE